MADVLLTPDRWRKLTRDLLERMSIFDDGFDRHQITEIVEHFTDGEIEKLVEALIKEKQ